MLKTDIKRYVQSNGLWTLMLAARHTRPATTLDGSIGDIAQYSYSGLSSRRERPITAEVWTDLGIDDVFASIDRCNCAVGQQVLYDMLRRPHESPEAVSVLADRINLLTGEPQALGRLKAALALIGGGQAYTVHRLLADDLPHPPKWRFVFPLLSLAAAIAIALMWYTPLTGVVLLICVMLANVTAQIVYRPRVQHLIGAISVIPYLMRAATAVADALPSTLSNEAKQLKQHRRLFRSTDWLALHLRREGNTSEIVGALTGYANLLFLADVNAFAFSIRELHRRRVELRYVIEYCGHLDALMAVIEFRERLERWCTPILSAGSRSVHGEGVFHPLIASAVPNDVVLGPHSIFITGSNMGGKTTYLRSTGLCAILAQTVATCPAKSWKAPCVVVSSLIDRADDLADGQSYFAVEARRIHEMIVAAEVSEMHLFLLDEPFKGTNTRERLAASRAVLDALNRTGHLCMVASHDTDLKELLKGQWCFWHFRDRVDASGMTYDYEMVAGTATEGNALRLLEQMGYPQEVLAESASTFARLNTERGTVQEVAGQTGGLDIV